MEENINLTNSTIKDIQQDCSSLDFGVSNNKTKELTRKIEDYKVDAAMNICTL